jgi:DNA-binding MarR family transcriptional regulator
VESFLHLVNVAGEALTAVEHYLGRHGMSRGRFMVLGVLARETPRAMCPSDLAAVCGVTPATITGLIDSLERDNMVTRQQSAGDHRMIHIRLTDEGRRFLDKVMPDYYRRVAQITVQLSPGEKVRDARGAGEDQGRESVNKSMTSPGGVNVKPNKIAAPSATRRRRSFLRGRLHQAARPF